MSEISPPYRCLPRFEQLLASFVVLPFLFDPVVGNMCYGEPVSGAVGVTPRGGHDAVAHHACSPRCSEGTV